MREDLKVITALKGFVTEEVDFFPVVLLHVVQREGLVPASREHVEADLTANAIAQTIVCLLYTSPSPRD